MKKLITMLILMAMVVIMASSCKTQNTCPAYHKDYKGRLKNG